MASPSLTEAARTELIDYCRQAETEQLLEDVQEVLAAEAVCRQVAGFDPDQTVPFWVNPIAGEVTEIILRELNLRDHDYVDQGTRPSSAEVN